MIYDFRVLISQIISDGLADILLSQTSVVLALLFVIVGMNLLHHLNKVMMRRKGGITIPFPISILGI